MSLTIRIASNIILASSAPSAAAVECHVTLAGGGDAVVDESLLHNGGGVVFKADDVAGGRTVVQVLRGTELRRSLELD